MHLPKERHQPARPTGTVADDMEDSGLFASGICQIMVELVPQSRRNDNGDLIVRGFVDRKFEVDIFFMGRRAVEACPLEFQLKALLRAARAIAAAANNPPPKIEALRLPVRIEGAWRRAMKRDPTGWETSSHYFVAARWSLLDQNGNSVSYGKTPTV